jgi:alpha-galactosidase
MTRRDFHAALLAAAPYSPRLQHAPGRVVDAAGGTLGNCRLTRRWQGPLCRSTVTNRGNAPVRLFEIVLFDWTHGLPGSTPLYGEGFQMLSQTGGTIAAPADIGAYTDRKHYRIPMPDDATTLYNVIALSPAPDRHLLLGFTSSNRFAGKFYLRRETLQVVLETENLELAPGQSWDLEQFFFHEGPDRAALFDRFAAPLEANHPRLPWPAPPEGWCSWYCFGPKVTAAQVIANLDFIEKNIPRLRYIQIDDGYQAAMGDWLETGQAFGGDIRAVLAEIRRRGFEPAIWVAPFIAEAGSRVFREHPEWFMRDESGAPLPSGKVTFGGWRRGPWYALDATHPGARAHLTDVFRVMNREWGCTYFKMDANFWGAMHGARLHDPARTRVEAYRLGMRAILDGAGKSFLLGCNHPLWPSLGLIHGARSSGDINRRWTTIRKLARENLSRNWQNGRLWWNDPDAIVLTGNLPEEEFLFHSAATYATGGMLLSGDDLTTISPERLEWLRRLKPTGKPAIFDPDLKLGRMAAPEGQVLIHLNWSNAPAEVPCPAGAVDLLTRRPVPSQLRLPPHAGRLVLLA